MLLPLACVSLLAVADRVEYLGRATIAADDIDRSGMTDILPGDCPHNRLGGLGSGIAYSGRDDVYFALPDRGPADGRTDWRCRVQVLDIKVDPASPISERVNVELKRTIMLHGSDGLPLVGNSAAVGSGDGDALHALRFDCEGIAVSPDGTLYISDEYGPCIDRFGLDGRRISRTLAPAKFVNPVSHAEPAKEMPPNSTFGRQNNRGLEGLTITPDGRKLVGIMQSPLLQDGALDEAGKRAGFNIRMLTTPLVDDGPNIADAREYVYRLESGGNGVNEILAISESEFLVVERDSGAGLDGRFRWIFRVDTRNATDVTSIDNLPQGDLPADITPVQKTLLLDFTDPKFDLAGTDGSGMPEKIEGLTWGPDLPDGRRLLFVTSDNDFSPTIPTFVWAFAVAKD